MRRFILLGMAVVLLFTGLTPAAWAATKTWTGSGGNANWSTAANWSPSGAPIANDTVLFNFPATSNANLGSVAIAAIVLGANSGGSIITGAVTINAFSATFNIDDQSTSATASSINATVAITATTLYIRSQNAAHTLNTKGVISGGFGVRVFGPGSVAFSGGNDNTYTGTTTVVSEGTLLLSGAGLKLVPGNLNIGDGSGVANSAKVKLTSFFSDLISDTSKVTIASDGQLDMGILSDTIAQLSGTGNVTMSGSNILTVGDTGNFTFDGVISGTGNVNKVDTGTMTYTAANTYTGLTTVTRGTLVLNAPSLAKAIRGPLTIGLGAGTVTTATVQLANFGQIDSATLPVTIQSDGKLDIGAFRDTVGAITMNGGNIAAASGGALFVQGGLNMTGGTINGAGTLGLRSDVVATASAALGVATINSNVELQIANVTFTVNSGSAQPELTIDGAVTLTLLVPSSLIVKTGSGTMRLAGIDANAYGGSTTIERGVLELAKPDSVTAITGPIVIGNGTDAPGSAVLKSLASNQFGGKPLLTINASGAYEVNANAQPQRSDTVGGLTGSGQLIMNNGPELNIDVASSTTLNFSGAITSPNVSGATQVVKYGGGEQVLSGSSVSYAGKLVAYGGVLRINGDLRGATTDGDSGATIGGTGRVANTSNFKGSIGAVIRPGNNGGTLTTADLSVLSGPLLIDLVNASPGGFGKINALGAVTLNSGLAPPLQLAAAPTFAPGVGTVFEIVTNDGSDAVVGTFAGLPQGATVSAGSRNFIISYTGGTGNDITLTVAKNTSVMTLSANPNPTYPPALGGNTTLSVAVASVGGVVPTGTVAFAINGTPLAACSAQPLSAGVASCFVSSSSLAPGTGSVAASYSGDTNYAAGSATPLSLVVSDTTASVLSVQVNGSSFGVVTSNPTGISCAGDCSEIYASGTVVTLTATPNAGSVFVGWGGNCIGRTSPCSVTVNGPRFANARFAPISIVGTTIKIDIDGDGKYLPETDGLLITRWVNGVSGPALTAGAVALPSKGGGATRVSDIDIQNYLNGIFTALDVSLSGSVNNTDSVLILRYLFGFRGAALVAGVTLPAGVTAAMVETNLAALTP